MVAFRAAQLKAMKHESVKHLPDKITALTFAAPVVGNYDYNKEFQALTIFTFLEGWQFEIVHSKWSESLSAP